MSCHIGLDKKSRYGNLIFRLIGDDRFGGIVMFPIHFPLDKYQFGNPDRLDQLSAHSGHLGFNLVYLSHNWQISKDTTL